MPAHHRVNMTRLVTFTALCSVIATLSVIALCFVLSDAPTRAWADHTKTLVLLATCSWVGLLAYTPWVRPSSSSVTA